MSEELIVRLARFALLEMRRKVGLTSSHEFGDMSFWIEGKFLVRCDNSFNLKYICNEKGEKIIHAR